MVREDWDAGWRGSRTAGDAVDWTGIVQRALDHGVGALLCRALVRNPDGAPPQIVDAAAKYLDGARRRGAVALAQTLDVLDVLRRGGIPALPFKGVTLAAAAHGSVAMRESRDIDVLVPRDAMAAAVGALGGLGYAPTETFSPRITTRCYRSYGQDILFADGRLPVEPHHAFGPHALAADIDVGGVWQRAVTLDLEGTPVPALSAEDTLLVACFHGSKEKWWRLLWVADIAAFASRHPQLDWSALLARARAYGIGRMVMLGLALARRVFATPLPAAVAGAIDADRACAELVDASLRNLGARDADVGSVHRVSTYHLRARERYFDRVRYVWRTVTTPQFMHYRMVALPDAMAGGYVAVKLAHDYALAPLARSATRLGLRPGSRGLPGPRP